MLINLATLDVALDAAQTVVQAYCHELGCWICVVEHKSPQPPPGAIELTYEEICQLGRLRSQGMTKQQALAAVGVAIGLPSHPGV